MSTPISHTRWLLYFVPRILFGYWLIWWIPHTIGAVIELFVMSGKDALMYPAVAISEAYLPLVRPYLDWYAENWPWTLISIIALWTFFMERAVRKGHFKYGR